MAFKTMALDTRQEYPHSYTNVLRDLRGPYSKHFDKVGCPLDWNSASPLWKLQLVHHVKNINSADRKQVIFADNFYA
jgi:hypothetical protein